MGDDVSPFWDTCELNEVDNALNLLIRVYDIRLSFQMCSVRDAMCIIHFAALLGCILSKDQDFKEFLRCKCERI